MAMHVEINFNRREKTAKIYENDEEITDLDYLDGKNLEEWFIPVETNRESWSGFIVALSERLYSEDISYEFIGDKESEKIFFHCMAQQDLDVSSDEIQLDVNKTKQEYLEIAFSYQNKNLHEACKYFKMASDLGDIEGAFQYGRCLLEGKGTEISNLKQ